MKSKLYIPDIECDSCVKLITKRFKSLEGIDAFEIKNDSVDVAFNEKEIKVKSIISAVESLGFRASEQPFDRKNLKERLRDVKENRDKYALELRAFSYFAYSFIALGLVEMLAYFAFFSHIPGFLGKYGWWLFYLNLSISAIGSAAWHFISYKAKATCMVGMMVGMTFGMQAGMMLGAVMGATNGFFVGAMAGMVTGVAIGALTGKCCGVMGVMQGMMAGVMGGTMGPMISIMMFADNLLLFMPVYMIINVAILAGMVYMVFEEMAEGKKEAVQAPPEFSLFISACVVAAFVFILIMAYGPKSFLIG